MVFYSCLSIQTSISFYDKGSLCMNIRGSQDIHVLKHVKACVVSFYKVFSQKIQLRGQRKPKTHTHCILQAVLKLFSNSPSKLLTQTEIFMFQNMYEHLCFLFISFVTKSTNHELAKAQDPYPFSIKKQHHKPNGVNVVLYRFYRI